MDDFDSGERGFFFRWVLAAGCWDAWNEDALLLWVVGRIVGRVDVSVWLWVGGVCDTWR